MHGYKLCARSPLMRLWNSLPLGEILESIFLFCKNCFILYYNLILKKIKTTVHLIIIYLYECTGIFSEYTAILSSNVVFLGKGGGAVFTFWSLKILILLSEGALVWYLRGKIQLLEYIIVVIWWPVSTW